MLWASKARVALILAISETVARFIQKCTSMKRICAPMATWRLHALTNINQVSDCFNWKARQIWRRGPESNRPTRICKHGTNTLDHRAHLLCTACNFRCAQSLQHCNSVFVKSVRSVVQCNALDLIVQTILTMCVCRTGNVFFTHDEPCNHPCFGAVTQLLLCVQ